MSKTLLNLVFSVAVIASFLLAGGGAYLLLRGGDRKRGALMLLVAAITLFNVWSWSTLPALPWRP